MEDVLIDAKVLTQPRNAQISRRALWVRKPVGHSNPCSGLVLHESRENIPRTVGMGSVRAAGRKKALWKQHTGCISIALSWGH